MPSRAWRLAILVLLSSLALDHVTSAQDKAPVVRETVQRGEALYQAGQFEAAIEVLKPVAKGNYSAIYRLSQAYQRLNKTQQFIEFALPLAEQGDIDAQYFLADAYESERKPNAPEVLRWYRSSAQGGLDLAADALGRIYYSGEFLGSSIDEDDAMKSFWRNPVESERYFELCVRLSQPRPLSSCLRGLAVLEADRPQRSAEKVLSLLQEAQDYQSLWLIYEFGFIAKKSEDQAADYLSRLRQRDNQTWKKYFLADVDSYKRGEPSGIRTMAIRLLPTGHMNITDAKIALALMKRAADSDDPQANWWMAYSFQKGRHVPIDDVLAYFYANRAHALGEQHAKKLLDELERRMSRQEIAEAQKMAREWAASHK